MNALNRQGRRSVMLLILACIVVGFAMFAKHQQQAAVKIPTITTVTMPDGTIMKVAPRFAHVVDEIRASLTDTQAVAVWLQAGALKPVERRR
jgi:hypothetical protein